jgi:hypothetical protein
VSEKADESRAVISKNAELERTVKDHANSLEIFQDKCDSQVMKNQDEAEEAELLYRHETVPETERLHDVIQALMVEKGETHYVESAQPRNPHVADRNALRCINATKEALKTLRSEVYKPIWDAGKVYMKRDIEPLSGQDILARLEAQEQDDEVKVAIGSAVDTSSGNRHRKPVFSKAVMKGLVPTQFMKPLAADARPSPKAQPTRKSLAVALAVQDLDPSPTP